MTRKQTIFWTKLPWKRKNWWKLMTTTLHMFLNSGKTFSALAHGPRCLKIRRLNWRTASRQEMQHSLASWPPLIQSVRKVRPPSTAYCRWKPPKNPFCCHQARCCIDSLQAIGPWWTSVVSCSLEDLVLDSAMLLKQKQTSAKRTDAPADCWIVLLIYALLLLPSYVFFFSFVTAPLEKWL